MVIDPMQLAELAGAAVTYSARLIAGGALASLLEQTSELTAIFVASIRKLQGTQ